jgi:uncharacterized membrane protein
MSGVEYAPGRRTVPARYRLWLAVVVGAAVGGALAVVAVWQIALLAAWDAAALTFVGWVWFAVRRLDGPQTRRHAVRDDPSRRTTHTATLIASVASLASVVVLLAAAPSGATAGRDLSAGFAVLSVVLSWTTVHTLFLLRYAELYYTEPVGGVDFGVDDPSYRDFAYLAFTIGMCFQVSDTELRTAARRVALQHALVSYLFGTIIVGTVVNVVAGLSG